MKTALALGIVVTVFLGGAPALLRSAPDSAEPQILIQTRFIEIPAGSLEEPAEPLPAPLDEPRNPPGPITLRDRQFQDVIRALNQRKGLDLFSAPAVTTRDNLDAKVEVTRPFDYKDETGRQIRKPCGIIFAVLPKIKADRRLDLDLTAQIVEFDGYVTHANGYKEPRFAESKARVHAVLTAGETIVLELDPRTDEQIVEDTDAAGRVISRQIVLHTSRRLVFITADFADPTPGKDKR